jgi:hypothetical protein
MNARAQAERAMEAIEQHGLLLVYPHGNRKQPLSLWSVLHPRSEMRWAWDADADPRVAQLWRLREGLARSRRVVYGKWYRGRAVFFSQSLFVAMLAELAPWQAELEREPREILRLLEDDSPQSSKQLRAAAGLRGKASERIWTRATTRLWELLLTVGTGEVDDGAFPSLLMGATRSVFEDLWERALRERDGRHAPLVAAKIPPASPFGKFFTDVKRRVSAATAPAPRRVLYDFTPGDIDR